MLSTLKLGLICAIAIALANAQASTNPQPDPKDQPVSVKTSFKPQNTRVVILPVVNSPTPRMKDFQKQEMADSLNQCRQYMAESFQNRGFQVIPFESIPATARLDAKNAKVLAKSLRADLVIQCCLEEMYSREAASVGMTAVFGLGAKKKQGEATIALTVYSPSLGYLINDRFVRTVSLNPKIGGTKHAVAKQRALKAVLALAFDDGMLKPYPLARKNAP